MPRDGRGPAGTVCSSEGSGCRGRRLVSVVSRVVCWGPPAVPSGPVCFAPASKSFPRSRKRRLGAGNGRLGFASRPLGPENRGRVGQSSPWDRETVSWDAAVPPSTRRVVYPGSPGVAATQHLGADGSELFSRRPEPLPRRAEPFPRKGDRLPPAPDAAPTMRNRFSATAAPRGARIRVATSVTGAPARPRPYPRTPASPASRRSPGSTATHGSPAG